MKSDCTLVASIGQKSKNSSQQIFATYLPTVSKKSKLLSGKPVFTGFVSRLSEKFLKVVNTCLRRDAAAVGQLRSK